MKSQWLQLFVATALMLMGDVVLGQEEPQVINIPLSRPGEPIYLEIGILSARIEVIGEDRDDVEFTISVSDGSRQIITPSGAKQLKGGGYAFEIDEEDNEISFDMDWRANTVSVIARVPRRADLDLGTTNDGEIIVSNITGNLELSNTNGPITAIGIRGSVIAESVNDDIKISFAEVVEGEAMALDSVSGDLFLGLPSNAGVQLHLDTSQGEIYSDFEVEVQPTKPIIERDSSRGGIEVRVESVIVANINGGGTIIRLRSLNGDIQISKSN